MTTAHRPTFFNALGHDMQGGNMMVPTNARRDRDENQELKMKVRGSKNEHLKSFRTRGDYLQELDKKEAEDQKDKKKREKEADPTKAVSGGYDSAKAFTNLPVVPEESAFPEDEDIEFGKKDDELSKSEDEEESSDDDSEDHEALMRELEKIKKEKEVEREKEEESSDDDSEDHEALMRELEKIKKEKEVEREKEEAEQRKVLDAERKEQAQSSNPILNQEQTLKRRWDEDTVFKDQMRTKPKESRRFINDSVRTGFHRRFIQKYLKVD